MMISLHKNVRTAGVSQATIYKWKSRTSVHDIYSMKIVKLLTDNGKEFTDRLFASRQRELTSKHEFNLP